MGITGNSADNNLHTLSSTLCTDLKGKSGYSVTVFGSRYAEFLQQILNGASVQLFNEGEENKYSSALTAESPPSSSLPSLPYFLLSSLLSFPSLITTADSITSHWRCLPFPHSKIYKLLSPDEVNWDVKDRSTTSGTVTPGRRGCTEHAWLPALSAAVKNEMDALINAAFLHNPFRLFHTLAVSKTGGGSSRSTASRPRQYFIRC